MPPHGCPEKYFTPAPARTARESSPPADECSAPWGWATPSLPRKLRRISSCTRSTGTRCNTATTSAIAPSNALRAFDGRRLAQSPLLCPAASASCLRQVLRDAVQAGAFVQAQMMRFGHRHTRGLHPRQTSPNRALLANLVRLEAVEVAKGAAPRFNRDGAGRQRRFVEFETPRRAHDDAVETLIVTGRAST